MKISLKTYLPSGGINNELELERAIVAHWWSTRPLHTVDSNEVNPTSHKASMQQGDDSDGDVAYLLNRPVALGILLMNAAICLLPLWNRGES